MLVLLMLRNSKAGNPSENTRREPTSMNASLSRPIRISRMPSPRSTKIGPVTDSEKRMMASRSVTSVVVALRHWDAPLYPGGRAEQ